MNARKKNIKVDGSGAIFVTQCFVLMKSVCRYNPNRNKFIRWCVPLPICLARHVFVHSQPLKYYADSNQILGNVSGRQTDQWRLPVRGSDPGLSGSLAVHPLWRLRSMTAEGRDGRLMWLRSRIFRGDERLTYRTRKKNYQCRALLSMLKFKQCCYTCQKKNNRPLIPLSDFKKKERNLSDKRNMLWFSCWNQCQIH